MRLIPLLLILATTAVFAQTASLPSSTQTVANPKTQKPDDPFGKNQRKSKVSKSTLNKNSGASKGDAKRPPDPLEKRRNKATMSKSMKKANAKAQMPPDPLEKNKNMK